MPLEMVRTTMATQTDRFGGMLVNLLQTPEHKMADLSELMVSDPTAAREYLEKGTGTLSGKGEARKGVKGLARNGDGKRLKR